MSRGPALSALLMVLVAGTIASGCLVTASTDFPERAPTRPYLSSADAAPPLSELIIVADATTRQFRTQVSAEDDGTPLQVLLVADWKTPRELIIQSAEVPAGSFDIPRRIGADWTPGSFTESGPRIDQGCHSFTLVVSHRFNRFDETLPLGVDDYDYLTWWVLLRDLQDPTSDAALLGTCPQEADQVTP
jgi:hypothetical protein